MGLSWRAALLIVGAMLSSTLGRAPMAAETALPSTVALDVFAQPTAIDLLTVEEQGKTARLFHARSVDGGVSWSARHSINLGGKAIASAHRGMDPQIAAVGDTLVAAWTTPGHTRWGDGPLATSISRDGGRTWAPGSNPADDGTADGHSFLELAADARGRFHAFWLDSRDGGQGLRGSVSVDEGRTWTKNVSLDTRTCECCWNKALAIEPDALVVLYRDKDPRDMALAVTANGGKTWSRRATVGAFNWGFTGCPHVGGGLAETRTASQHFLHAIVWTGADGREGVYVLRSGDEGRQWSEPRRLGNTYARHTDVAAHDDEVAAVWDETGGGRSAILIAISRDQGATWGQPQPLSGAPHASHPLIVASNGGFVVFWTEQTAHGELTWKTATIGDVSTASNVPAHATSVALTSAR